MCGIAGVVYTDPERTVAPECLARLCDTLRHRGPDGAGTWFGPGVALGHRRLAIIDLSPAGRQPMCNEDATVWLTFNGEIYNFPALRQELEQRGHRFASRTDSEVIVHLYEDLGPQCVERLHGMFAFAVWDTRCRRLLLARDRVGKKPLKYVEIEGGLAFASELKALLAAGLAEREIDLVQIDQYLTLGYVPSPGTGFARIRKLPPAHRLLWEDGRVRVERYWSLDFRRKERRRDEEWLVAIRQAVQDAVARRLMSDVPLGVFLSGGIDSSIVTACTAMVSTRPVETFSIGFEHETYNELPHARLVAERYATHHHEFVVRADNADLLPVLASCYEEPYADSSALPSYYLAQQTRRHVTVALNGDGGDEGFAGYRRYADCAAWSARLRWLHTSGMRTLADFGRRADGMLPMRWVRKLDAVHHLSDPMLPVRYGWMMRHFSDREKARMYGEPMRPYLAQSCLSLFGMWMNNPHAGNAALDRMLFADTMTYLPEDLLVKIDIATMAHGLEARSPLLDHTVLELAATIPAEQKIGNGDLKRLLREAFRDSLPPALLRKPKQGFGIPVHDWFRGPLLPLACDMLLSPGAAVQDYLRREALTALVDQHARGRDQRGHLLWTLVMLELWHREVVRRKEW